jgi:hypothetical protein
MKSFKQFKTQIDEMFDRPARWKMVSSNNDQLEYKSNINGKELVVTFFRVYENYWNMIFAVDDDLSITGKGDEVKVFSTVVDIMSNFAENENPEEIRFFAEKSPTNGNSRDRLYSRLIGRFAKSHGYRLGKEEDLGFKVNYRLVKV